MLPVRLWRTPWYRPDGEWLAPMARGRSPLRAPPARPTPTGNSSGPAATRLRAGGLDISVTSGTDTWLFLLPDAGEQTVRLPAVGAAVVRGTIRSADGLPLRGATVALERQASAPGELTVRRTATTDGDGHYAVSGLPVGTYTLSADYPGCATIRKPLALGAADATVDLALPPAGSLLVAVTTDPPTTGRWVRVSAEVEGDDTTRVTTLTRTGTPALLTNLRLGATYTIVVTAAGDQRATTTATVQPGLPSPITLRLAAAQ